MTTDLSKLDIVAMDYHQKVKALDMITQEILNQQVRFADVASEYTRIKANIDILKSVKSSLQSSIRAEGVY